MIVFLVIAVSCSKASPPTSSPAPTPKGDYKTKATDWFLQSISSDGRTLSIVYTMSGVASGCERKATAQAVESADKVIVTANKSVLQGNHACTEELGYIDAFVTLNSPLGSRTLVGCRVGKQAVSENSVCRDVERGRRGGVPPPYPSPTG
jgi:hypothetical protein